MIIRIALCVCGGLKRRISVYLLTFDGCKIICRSKRRIDPWEPESSEVDLGKLEVSKADPIKTQRIEPIDLKWSWIPKDACDSPTKKTQPVFCEKQDSEVEKNAWEFQLKKVINESITLYCNEAIGNSNKPSYSGSCIIWARQWEMNEQATLRRSIRMAAVFKAPSTMFLCIFYAEIYGQNEQTHIFHTAEFDQKKILTRCLYLES